MTKRRKVAVSISAEALAAAERLSQQTGQSRSAVFERALQALLTAERQAERTRRYLNGYRRRPEGRREAAAALGLAMTTLAAEPWNEAR